MAFGHAQNDIHSGVKYVAFFQGVENEGSNTETDRIVI